MRITILAMCVISSFSQAIVMPARFIVERPVLTARLELIGDESVAEFRLDLSRPAQSQLATSFSFSERIPGTRCGGRCGAQVLDFRVTHVTTDRCGITTYRAIEQAAARQTDELPDMEGAYSALLTVIDSTRGTCELEEGNWDIEFAEGGVIRYFKGTPEAVLTIQ